MVPMTSPTILHRAADVFSIESAETILAFPKLTAVISGERVPILLTTSPINKSSFSLEP